MFVVVEIEDAPSLGTGLFVVERLLEYSDGDSRTVTVDGKPYSGRVVGAVSEAPPMDLTKTSWSSNRVRRRGVERR